MKCEVCRRSALANGGILLGMAVVWVADNVFQGTIGGVVICMLSALAAHLRHSLTESAPRNREEGT